MIGVGGGSEGVDEDFAHHSMDGIRRLHPWPEYVRSNAGRLTGRRLEGTVGRQGSLHAPTFILTSHPQEPIKMEAGTSFHFVPNGIYAALERARDVAGSQDVKIAGGVMTVRQISASRTDR